MAGRKRTRIVWASAWALIAGGAAYLVSSLLLYLFEWGPNVDYGEACVSSCPTPVHSLILALAIALLAAGVVFALVTRTSWRPQLSMSARRPIGFVSLAAGTLACAYGALYWLAIPSSDTSTSSLVWSGIAFALPGLMAIAAGIRLFGTTPGSRDASSLTD